MRYLFTLLLLSQCLSLLAFEPEHFSHKAAIQGSLSANEPVRVPLSSDLIRHSQPGFPDVRLFDETGGETPYVIHTRHKVEGNTRHFTFEVVAYALDGETETLVLKRPDNIADMIRLQIETQAKDFRRHVRIEASDDRQTWELLTEDLIFDFSSRVELRQTTMDLPKTSARYLKLIIGEAKTGVDGTSRLQLEYKDLKLDVSALQAGAFKIAHITGLAGQKVTVESQLDSFRQDAPETALDQAGNSVIALGRLNLPLESVELAVSAPYFYRTAQIWTSETGKEKEWRCAATGLIYNIPGMKKAHVKLTPNLGRAQYVKLIIVNGDNPPLNVGSVEIRWLRRELSFIPEANHTYTVFTGNAKVTAPSYETGHLIPYEAPRIADMPESVLGPVVANSAYNANAPINDAEATERTQRRLFTFLAIVVAIVLGAWMYKLLRDVKARDEAS